ncbi:MAG: 1,4-dihydroxy-2-naphthoate polyprenyltransferase [Acidimicrobiales bacterium]
MSDQRGSPPAPGNRWVAGARPRTLPAAVVPVAVGTACAYAELGRGQHLIEWRVLAALVVSLALQIGTNYANDYSDGIRGTDVARVGPVRLVASGLAAPKAVKVAAMASFAVAAVAGLALSIAVGPELLVVGALAIAAGWFYTGGPRPYGYAGFGEVFVFVFFGLVATAGSAYVQSRHLHQLELVAAIPVGLLATALLVVNNLRDIPGDSLSGKRTLAVRLGEDRTRLLYVGCLAFAFGALLYVGADRIGGLVALLAAPFAVFPVRAVLRRAAGRELIPVLGATGRLQLVFGLLLTVGLVLG